MQPNVVLLVLDAARRDAFEPYGAAPGSTPAIAQMASRGASLPDVYATSSWTVPSHASLFTGLLPRAAGLSRVPSPTAVKPRLEEHRERLLPEVMRRAGYTTGAASANLWLSRMTGFDTGFDQFEQIDTDRNAQMHLTSRKDRLRWLVEAGRGRVDDGAAKIEEILTSWLADPSRRPFFWFVNLLECHSPYLPPRPYGDVSLVDRVAAARDAREHYRLETIWRACAGIDQVPEETLDRVRRLYNGAIRYMDDWVGRLLERLDQAGILEETLVLVMSDHGENLGEGGLVAHALSLDNRLIHVPLVCCGPGAGDWAINSLGEVPRMVAEAAGLEEHPWQDPFPPGFGLAQLDPPVETVDAEIAEAAAGVGLEDALDLLTTPLTCAVADGLKLMRRGGVEELYDLEADPLELAPRAPDTAEFNGRRQEVASLRAALDHPAVASQWDEPAASADVPAPSAEEVQELEDRMRMLGYL
jgi:arylsulfatase A-like enzyme